MAGFMRDKLVYLVGALNLADDGGVNWRKQIIPKLAELGILAIDPCDKPVDCISETPEAHSEREKLKSDGNYDAFSADFKTIRWLDLRFTEAADFLIVYINLDEYACGTYEEVAHANKMKKPILVFSKQTKAKIPSWLFGQLPHQLFFSTMDELIHYLHEVDVCPPEKRHRRWMPFNIFNVIDNLRKKRDGENQEENCNDQA